MNAIAVIVDADSNWRLLRISSPMPRKRSCPQKKGLRTRFVAQPEGIRSGKTRSGSARERYTIILIADP
nr:hypothetical protein [Sporolactobacillus sp. THM19-2]